MLSAKTFFETPAAQLTAQAEQEFFSSLMASNKTYKTTFRQRFADVNPQLIERLKDHATGPLRVLDIGVSYGVSTAELYDELKQAGMVVTLTATDVLTDAVLVRVGPGCYALLDGAGFPLRFDLPFGTMKPWVTSGDVRTGRFLFRKICNTVLTHRARRILANASDGQVKHVRLLAPRLLANADITVRTDDVSRYNDAFAGKFNLIRAANVLNKGYFADDALTSMVANVRRYLDAPGSHLFVVRTYQDNGNHGTLFRLTESGRFEVVWRVGDGSEIEAVVTSAEPDATCRRSASSSVPER